MIGVRHLCSFVSIECNQQPTTATVIHTFIGVCVAFAEPHSTIFDYKLLPYATGTQHTVQSAR